MENSQEATRGRELLTVPEVAERLKISRMQVRRLYAELGAIWIGRAVRFPVERIDEYVDRLEAEAADRIGAGR